MYLGHKRKLSNDNINDSNNQNGSQSPSGSGSSEIEDINAPLVLQVSYINYSKYTLSLDLNTPDIEAKRKQFKIPSVRQPQPQEKGIKENYTFNYISPKFETLCLQEISMTSLLHLYPNRKINIVLDLDQTIIHSKPIELFNSKSKQLLTNESHTIKGIINETKFALYFNFRPFFKEFISLLKPFASFYIFTLSHQNYARLVVDIIRNTTGIELSEERVISMKTQEEAMHFQKSLSHYRDINPTNTLIVDDSAVKWDRLNIPNLLLSKRYMSFFDEDGLGYHYVIEDKPPQENICFFDDQECRLPIFLENELSKRFQLKYLAIFIEQTFKLSLIRNEEIVFCYQKLRKRILNKRSINFTYLGLATEIGFLKGIVKYLGGKVTLDKGATTHFVISQSNIQIFKDNCLSELKNRKYYCVNVKWLFYSYFFLTKMNEQHEDFMVQL